MLTAWRLTALVPVIVVLISAPAATQSFYGSLISVTQDAQGGVIPGATVVLTNTATNDRREGVTGADGAYRFVNLVPGTYRLEVELSGFQRYVRDQIVVNVQSTPRCSSAVYRKRYRSLAKRRCCRPKTRRSARLSAAAPCRNCRSTDGTCSI
jgi:hypothetical protein